MSYSSKTDFLRNVFKDYIFAHFKTIINRGTLVFKISMPIFFKKKAQAKCNLFFAEVVALCFQGAIYNKLYEHFHEGNISEDDLIEWMNALDEVLISILNRAGLSPILLSILRTNFESSLNYSSERFVNNFIEDQFPRILQSVAYAYKDDFTIDDDADPVSITHLAMYEATRLYSELNAEIRASKF